MERTRQSGIFNASRLTVTFIGVGGIGALAAVTLAKMGVGYITLFDNDKVDTVNLGSQFYRVSDVEKYKVDAVIDQVHDLTDDVEVAGYAMRVSAEDVSLLYPHVASDITISAVDSIVARQDIWDLVKNKAGWYIDARMASESFQAYIINMNEDTEWYDNLIKGQKDEDIPDEPCTSKATFYTAALAAAHVGNIVRKIITGKPLPKRIVQDLVSNTLLVI